MLDGHIAVIFRSFCDRFAEAAGQYFTLILRPCVSYRPAWRLKQAARKRLKQAGSNKGFKLAAQMSGLKEAQTRRLKEAQTSWLK